MKKLDLLYCITVIVLFLHCNTALAQINAVVKDSSSVHKDETSAANVTNLSVVVTPESGKSFVDNSGTVVSSQLPYTIAESENNTDVAVFRCAVPLDATGKSYNSHFSGTFAGSGSGQPVQWNVLTKNIIKDAKLNLASVHFREGFPITHDNGNIIPEPQWIKNLSSNETETYPIGYVRNTALQMTAIFKIDDVSALPNGSTVKIRASSDYNGHSFPATDANIEFGYARAINNNCGTVVNKVDYKNKVKFQWEYQLRPGGEWRACGDSENEMFVTLAVPANTFRARSVFYIACKNTGAITASQAANNVWASFAGRNVKIWNENNKSYSRQLSYYGTSNGNNNLSAASMFADTGINGNQGQCGAWMDLLSQTLTVHRIRHNGILLKPPLPYSAFGVKNLSLDADGHIINMAGIPGQNKSTPSAKLFQLHYIVQGLNNAMGQPVYLDPSYGEWRNSITDYTRDAVDLWLNNEWKVDSSAVLKIGP
ncbi:hypothetical protein FACS18942_00080 [Planctomycetales bacterium]|nr:hypothetical protein FACS18942_00080 [Planctomycetales bacterium]